MSIATLVRALSALAASGAATKQHHYANALRKSQTKAGGADVSPGSAVRVPLLVLIFTQRSNVERRREQRATWLGYRWQRGEIRPPPGAPAAAPERGFVAWRYVYVLARDGQEQADAMDRVVGDTVTLAAVRESYANLVYKTLEALRWAIAHVPFGCVLRSPEPWRCELPAVVAVSRGRAHAFCGWFLRSTQDGRRLYCARRAGGALAALAQ